MVLNCCMNATKITSGSHISPNYTEQLLNSVKLDRHFSFHINRLQ